MEELLRSRIFRVVRYPVPNPDGTWRDIDLVNHPGAVVVLPLFGDDEVVLIRNFRHTVGRELWELPAGTLDHEGESPEQAAIRELEEETGYRAGAIRPLGHLYPSPGILTEIIHAFVAKDLRRTQQRLEPTEQITVQPMPLAEAVRMAGDGRIEDAKTIITLLRWDWHQRMQA